jgi:hypothetical protein
VFLVVRGYHLKGGVRTHRSRTIATVHLQIPARLEELIAGSRQRAGVFGLLDVAGSLLADNQTPFFPAYTDHGVDHVQSVLDAAVALVPDDVWEARLLGAQDAAVLVCAIVLHDLALHVRERGFLQLIAPESPFAPVEWFAQPHGARPADLTWAASWKAFRKKARHLSPSQLDRLLGPAHRGVPRIAHPARDEDPSSWTDADRLLIGEFLRRHHGRLAHEIALHGFPGTAETEFPVLSTTLPRLADAIGVVARSHNEELRLALDYVRHRHHGSRRPAQARLPYLMALLRIADYFQIQAERAPALLLHLRAPSSPQSLAEWSKHGAIATVEWEHDDPGAVYVDVEEVQSVALFLQIQELLADLQRELDTTTSVLAETYAEPRTSALRLSRRRISTNLLEPSYHAGLPFVPRHARPRSAEDLFRLVVGDLYGDNPEVAARELVQNAVDAVRERRRWEQEHGAVDEHDLPDIGADVLVELRQLDDDGAALLRIVDRGIGMTPDTAIDYFMTAGASFSPRRDEGPPRTPADAVRSMKAGRFGIGVFAAFLLGDEVRVRTRHAADRRGVAFRYRVGDDQVQLDWSDGPVGTEVTVPFDPGALPLQRWFGSRFDARLVPAVLQRLAGFYVLREPSVRYVAVGGDGPPFELDSSADVPADAQALSDDWRAAESDQFDALLWRLPLTADRSRAARVTHNGIVIAEPGRLANAPGYGWTSAGGRLFGRPEVAVFDSRHELPFTLTRYRLAEPGLPCEQSLLRSISRDVVAQALACGPVRHPLMRTWELQPALGRTGWTPLLPAVLGDERLCVVWVGPGRDRAIASRFQQGEDDERRAWERFPTRAVLAARSEPELDLLVPVRGVWSAVLGDVGDAAERFGRALGRNNLVTVAVTRDESIFGSGRASSRLRDKRGWRRARSAPFAATERYVLERSDQGGDPARLVAELLDVAEAMVGAADGGAVGITLFSIPTRFAAWPGNVMADTWTELVGGQVARDEAERARQTAAVVERHPDLGAMVDAWRRTAASGADWSS